MHDFQSGDRQPDEREKIKERVRQNEMTQAEAQVWAADNNQQPFEFLDDAGKARQVWRAACGLKPSSLDASQLSALGHSLGWAHTWLQTDLESTSDGLAKEELVCLEKIERAAKELAELLAVDNKAMRRLERFYPDFMGRDAPPDLCATRRGIVSIATAARSAKVERKKIRHISSPKGASPMDRYIFELAKIYAKYAGKGGGAGTGKHGEKDSPFIRFVQESARQFGARVPSPSTIEAALRKKARIPEQHIIALVKSQSQ
jgi:hypothetical protein